MGDRSDRIAPRVPCFAPVVATTLTHCWTTNISASGMGLFARAEGDAIPQPGDDLELEWLLGAVPIRAVVRVAWTSRVRDGWLGFGVAFRELSEHARGQLERFLAEHRPTVVVVGASEAEQALARECLGGVDLELVDAAQPALLRRAASVILFADDVAQITALFEGPEETVPNDLPLASVTIVTCADDELLMPLFAAEKIYEVLRRPLDAPTLARTTERSCERWALKFELRWASLQLEGSALARQRMPASAPEPPAHGSHIVRISEPMQRVYELIRTVAVHDVPVLLVGETGTGKELAAREIHALSRRAHTPFVAQDCGALIETLLESELFGHVRGAFTGATSDHPGLFQIADGGTIFLDEIQNTSPALQAKLLRVIEEGEVRPVGGTRARRVDVRLIAACNVDLDTAVAEARFRSDFYYRLNRFPIQLPPLRDHAEDILPLARYFVGTVCASLRRTPPRIEPRAERALLAYTWPGNIRELKNAVERALLLTQPNEPLRWESLPDAVRRNGHAARPLSCVKGLDAQVSDFERELISRALARHEGVVRRAARELDIHAVTLSRKMKKLGLA